MLKLLASRSNRRGKTAAAPKFSPEFFTEMQSQEGHCELNNLIQETFVSVDPGSVQEGESFRLTIKRQFYKAREEKFQ